MYRLTYQDGETPQSFTFASGDVVIGRSPDCQIVLRDFGISRNHAKVVVSEAGDARIMDLKSKNGTQVNGVPIVEAPLRDGAGRVWAVADPEPSDGRSLRSSLPCSSSSRCRACRPTRAPASWS